ncbi:MAG: HAD family hydrolase [Clostridium sp.]
MFKGVIFDLDGTLLNTIDDLANACNYALERSNFPTYEVERYKTFVGNGRTKLIEAIIPLEKKNSKTINDVLALFDEYYGKHMVDMTKPYEGIIELLEVLNEKGIKTAVVSNKPHEFAGEVVKEFLGDRIVTVFGHRQGYKAKPNPDTVLEVINDFNLDKSEILYVGDSNVDIITAKNAGVKSIGVLWGFRTEEELKAEGATFIANNIKELREIIMGLS